MAEYIVGIDQSTQGTKAILLNQKGQILRRADKSHKQLIDKNGWIEHDPEEIYKNTVAVVGQLLRESGIHSTEIKAVGISNQRETALVWNKKTGKPLYHAIVWQCARGEGICRQIEEENSNAVKIIKEKTGLPLSPYFSAAKLAWIMENVEEAKSLAQKEEICCGTVDSWLVYKLTGGKEFRTDYSNASRTQLFNISNLSWDEELCEFFGISLKSLAEVTDSDGFYGMTDFEGLLSCKVPIHGVLGDSHGALFGQGCLEPGMMKATYGTGSSIMMNIGEMPIFSELGIVTSLAWKTRGKVQYVLEGNINYTGAVITWMKNQIGILTSVEESETLANEANTMDRTYLVPAFSGLGAPYWRSDVTATFTGMSRTTGRAEMVRAGLECIAYQICDIVQLMTEESDIHEIELRVDGGPTKNSWLMQFQSDILNCKVRIPEAEELSGIGAAYAAGLGIGIYGENVFQELRSTSFDIKMDNVRRKEKYQGWKDAVALVLGMPK